MPSPEAVAAAKTRWSQVVPDSIATGRQLYLAKCNYCHDYPDVRAIDRNDWPDIMRKMGPKSNLDPAQTQAVLSFILAAVSQP